MKKIKIEFDNKLENILNKGKLGSSRPFLNKRGGEYYQKQRRYMKLTETTVKTITNKQRDI